MRERKKEMRGARVDESDYAARKAVERRDENSTRPAKAEGAGL